MPKPVERVPKKLKVKRRDPTAARGALKNIQDLWCDPPRFGIVLEQRSYLIEKRLRNKSGVNFSVTVKKASLRVSRAN